ncbi:hypothetical protein [Spirosoma utsteinense]|uniref:hypothetical protein n=1 Tax=Spirosoma utsteinense TaxID=2585773 RepID=UPI001647AFE1|nr:hypothetical protein [Spirosoma utsteinense]MBC3785739.1 hypothetical protein [Spirosoma utsteinense]
MTQTQHSARSLAYDKVANWSEAKLQAVCFQYHWNKFPAERGLLHSNNNNSQNAIKGNLNKAIGTVPGVSDLEYVAEGFTCYIELKLPGQSQSPDQKVFEALVTSRNHPYLIIRDPDSFEHLIADLQQGQRPTWKGQYDIDAIEYQLPYH